DHRARGGGDGAAAAGWRYHRRAVAVVRHLADEPADAIEKPVQLRRRVVEAPGARPSVGAGEDRVVAGRRLDALQLVGDAVEHRFPVDRDERLGPATTAVAGSVEPALPDHRLR